MPVYAAFLRAVNLGSRNRISMADLCRLFEEGVGAADVATHGQSGNVAFRHPERSATRLAAVVATGISDSFGLDVKVLLRTEAELARVVGDSPLAASADVSELHVTFLVGRPAADRVSALDPSKFAPDRLAVVGREVHLHCPGGYGRSKLSNAFLERKLAQPATTRNWKTVTTVADLTAAR